MYNYKQHGNITNKQTGVVEKIRLFNDYGVGANQIYLIHLFSIVEENALHACVKITIRISTRFYAYTCIYIEWFKVKKKFSLTKQNHVRLTLTLKITAENKMK